MPAVALPCPAFLQRASHSFAKISVMIERHRHRPLNAMAMEAAISRDKIHAKGGGPEGFSPSDAWHCPEPERRSRFEKFGPISGPPGPASIFFEHGC